MPDVFVFSGDKVSEPERTNREIQIEKANCLGGKILVLPVGQLGGAREPWWFGQGSPVS